MTEAGIPNQARVRRPALTAVSAVIIFVSVTVLLTVTLILLPLPPLVAPMLVVFLPTLIAKLLTAYTDGWLQIGPRLFSARAWRISLKWALIILGVALALRLGHAFFALLMGYPFQPQGFTPFLVITLLFAAGEEIGWRGYALPLTLKRFSPLAAALLLGVPWALMHAPLTLPGKMLAGVPVIALLLQMLALSVLTTWAYLASGRSLLGPVLLHGGQNTLVFLSNGVPLVPSNWAMAAFYCLAALAVILLTRGRLDHVHP